MSTVTMSVPTSTEAAALRAYIAALRSEQHISQDDLAEAIGMPPRTYKAWESGPTEDIKAPFAIRAIKFLGGALEHLADFDRLSPSDAEQLARDWLRLTPDQRRQAVRIQSKFRRVIELSEQDPTQMERVVTRLRADAQADPAVLDLVMAWLDGRRSR